MSKKNPTPGDQRQSFKTNVNEMEWNARFWKAQFELMYYEMAASKIMPDYQAFLDRGKTAETAPEATNETDTSTTYEHTITNEDLENNPELVGQVEVGDPITLDSADFVPEESVSLNAE
jgi:hypothetical protein